MDNRNDYFTIVERRLSYLKTRVELSNSLNLTDINIHAENFYRDFFNKLGFSFTDTNFDHQNAAYVDLIDKENKQAFQVTSRTDNTKIQEALDGFHAKDEYKGYKLQLLLIGKNAKEYTSDFGHGFIQAEDVWDVKRLLAFIKDLQTEGIGIIADFLRTEIPFDDNIQISASKADRPGQITRPEVHLNREVTTSEESFEELIGDKRKTLLDCIIKYNAIAFLGWGLSGKSDEVLYTANILSGPGYYWHVFIVDMGFYKGQDIGTFIPDFDNRDQPEIVLFLDGLDEVAPDFYRVALDSILLFRKTYPKVRLIVSCRTNVYVEDQNPEFSTLPNFKAIRLKDLSNGAVNEYLQKTVNNQTGVFFKKLKEGGLDNLVYIPYYLVQFARKFGEKGSIYADKGELFEDVVSLAIKTDIAKYYRDKTVEKGKQVRKALDKIAYITEVQGKNVFSSEELSFLFDDATTELVLKMGRLIKGDPVTGQWAFFHHNIQEYLAAKVLSGFTYDKIEHLLVAAKGSLAIKPAMISTISFLFGLTEKNPDLRAGMISLLANSEIALLMKFEARYLGDTFRKHAFEQVFGYYKQSQRSINKRRFDLVELAAFSQTEGNFEYLIEEIERNESDIDAGNALDLLLYYDFEEFPVLHARFYDLLVKMLPLASNDVKFKVVLLLINHNDYDAAGFRFIFDELKDNAYTHLRALLFTGILQFNLGLHFRDFIIEQTAELVREEQMLPLMAGNTRSGTESHRLVEILAGLSDEDSLLKKLEMIERQPKAFVRSINFRKIIPTVLLQAEGYASHSNLINFIVRLYVNNVRELGTDLRRNGNWIKYFNTLGLQQEVFNSFIAKYGKIDFQNAIAIAELCNDELIGHIVGLASKGLVSVDDAGNIQWQLVQSDIERARRFHKAFEQAKIALAFPTIIDGAKREHDEFRLKADAIFIKRQFLGQVEKMFNATGKNTIRYDDLHHIASGNHLVSEFYYWLYSCFDFKRPGNGGYSIVEIENFERLRGSELFASRVYDLLKDKPKIRPEESEIEMIKEWCTAAEAGLDFEKEIHYPTTRILKHNDEELFVFMLRRLGISGFEKDTYLDMLYYYDGSGSSEKIYEYVLRFVQLKDVKSRILQNLALKKVETMVLLDHVDFVDRYNCKSAHKSIFAYLQDGPSYKWEYILDVYIRLGSNLEELFQLLPLVDEQNLHFLFDRLKSTNQPRLQSILKGMFVLSHQAKLKTTKYLIQLGDEDAFKFYVLELKSSQVLPELFSVFGQIDSGYKSALAESALELFEFSYSSPFRYNYSHNPLAVSEAVLQTMALDIENYAAFRQQIIDYLDDIKSSAVEKSSEIAEHLERALEIWDHGHQQRNTTFLNFSDALKSFSNLMDEV